MSSFRLDKVIAATFKLSRSQASQLVSSGLVKVNYATTTNSSYAVDLNDLVSVRRFGRLKMVSENGISKSGKYKVTVEVLLSKK